MADFPEPVLPIPTRLPNRDDLSKALDIAKSFLVPNDPYQAAGQAVEQARAGDYAGALETGLSYLPQTGMAKRVALPMDEASRLARAKELGFTGPWYHGSERTDRLVGSGKINPKRATSGPMPYFTDDPEIASNYAKSKSDTSLAAVDDGDVSNYFTVNPKDMGWSGRTPIPVERTWPFLSAEAKQTIIDRAKRIGYEVPDEAMGPLTLHPEGVEATLSPSHYDYILKTEARGNPLSALREMWLNGGELIGNEGQLEDIYRLAGYPYPISQTNAPWTQAIGVMPAMLRMQRPLDTSRGEEILQRVIPHLEDTFARDRTRTANYGVDMWDKNHRFTPKDWTSQLKEDVGAGKNSYVYTSIPDKVTAALRQLGYDSILDTGGKMGGEGHNVAIPFDPNQVRSRFAVFDPKHIDSTDLLKSEGGSISIPYGAGSEPYDADDALPYNGGKQPYTRKKKKADGGALYDGPTLPIPDRLPNWSDVGKAVDVAKSFLTPPDPYEAAGHAVEQYRAGNPIDAAVTLASSLPMLGNARSPYERKLSPQGFYSHGAESAHNLPQETMTVQQARKMLEKAGTKPEEFRWSGFDTAFADPMAKVSRPDLVRHFEENAPKLGETVLGGHHAANVTQRTADEALLDMLNDVPRDDYHAAQEAARIATAEAKKEGWREPKFQQYTLPGGESYREVLTTLQGSPRSWEQARNDAVAKWPGTDALDYASLPDERRRVFDDLFGGENDFRRRALSSPQPENAYRSSHWDEPNVLNHLRMSERPGNVLHLEELQSDWGQQARKNGVMGRIPTDDEVRDFFKLVPEANPADFRDEMMEHRDFKRGLVPNSPFIGSTQNWTDLGLKRALYEAAKANAEHLAWTPGAEQAARYDLAKHLDMLAYHPEKQMLRGWDREGYLPIEEHVPKENLPSYVGKDVADKLLSRPLDESSGEHVLSGQQLTVGGEGMKSYYDQMLPSRLKAVLKPIERNPQFTTVPVEDKTIPALKLTPEMLDYIRKGLPYYASGGEVSAPITGEHTITMDDLIGRAAGPASSPGAYTDAGGQKIGAPYVSGMANGYPIYSPQTAISDALNVAQSILPKHKRGMNTGTPVYTLAGA